MLSYVFSLPEVGVSELRAKLVPLDVKGKGCPELYVNRSVHLQLYPAAKAEGQLFIAASLIVSSWP